MNTGAKTAHLYSFLFFRRTHNLCRMVHNFVTVTHFCLCGSRFATSSDHRRVSMKMKRMKSDVISATIESYLKRRHYQVLRVTLAFTASFHVRVKLLKAERVVINLRHLRHVRRPTTSIARAISCFVRAAIK